MEPLGVTANILGVVVPAVQAVRLLIDDIQRISDAPAAITSLRAELVTSHDILDSLRRTEELPWNSLGETIMAQSMSANTSYEESCKRLRAALNRWTRHSDDASGRLTFLDRTNVGFFKQSQLKTMTAAVEKCKTTLTLVVNVGTLHSQLQQSRLTEETKAAVISTESRIVAAMSQQDMQLAELNSTLQSLVLVRQDGRETEADRLGAMSQVTTDLELLKSSKGLLRDLLSDMQAAAANAGWQEPDERQVRGSQ
jgi:hypothetical protein